MKIYAFLCENTLLLNSTVLLLRYCAVCS